jgi:hypothetical protein
MVSHLYNIIVNNRELNQRDYRGVEAVVNPKFVNIIVKGYCQATIIS